MASNWRWYDAVGGALLREFAYAYCADNRCVDGFSGAFDANNPTTTPSGVPTDGSALVALAKPLRYGTGS